MVMCEECDTWQHITCYYPNELVPAVHFCEDCGSKYQDAKQAAKRRKVDHKAASLNHDPSDDMGRSVAETVYSHCHKFSPDLASTAFPNVISKRRGREAASDDELFISRGTKIEIANSNSSTVIVKTKPDATTTTGAGQYILSDPAKSTSEVIDLTDDSKDTTKVKIETRDDCLTGGAPPLLSQLISPMSSPPTNFSIVPVTGHPTTPMITPTLTPQPPPSTPTSLEAGITPQLVNKATTFVFLDSHNRELRRRTFEDLGGRFNVGTLFGQAVRAGLINKYDSEAILSVTIRGISETFAILKDDKPDFTRLMQNIEAAGLCMVEVRLD
jgi:hypothetical protein